MRALLDSTLFRPQPGWLVAGLALLAVVSLTPALSRDMPLQDSREWPVAALNHIQKHGLKGRFFGPPDYGAYVGWRLKEDGLAYTDTRGFFFPPLLLEDSHFLPQLGPDWRTRLDRVLDDHRTDFFLLETQGPRGKLWELLRGQVRQPLYLDEQSVLLSARQVRDALGRAEHTAHAR
jgi:hypothetical protein